MLTIKEQWTDFKHLRQKGNYFLQRMTYSLSQPEITRSTYNKNGELHTFIQTYLTNKWQQPDKQTKDESLFELLISKLIKSEHARVREQHCFLDWREKIQGNVGRDNWSDKNWLNAKFIQSVESIEYINHFVISHFNNSNPQLYFLNSQVSKLVQKLVLYNQEYRL